ncbi:hypothetical protein ES703_38825 [subsurface metagenome]
MTQNKRETLNLRKAKTPVTLNEVSKDAKTPLMLKVEERFGKDIREFLKQHYIEIGLTWDEIGEITKVSPKTLWEWGQRFGIKSRNVPNNKPNTVEERFRDTSGYKHVKCCLCPTCQGTSSRCSYTKIHERGYCVLGCTSYKWRKLT